MKVYYIQYHRADYASWVIGIYQDCENAIKKLEDIVNYGHYTNLESQPDIEAGVWKRIDRRWYTSGENYIGINTANVE